jgi:hypothetical protein
MSGDIALPNFEHPDEAIYCFGSDDHNQPLVECATKVYIPTPSGTKHPMWSFQAGLIVFYDRWRRHG